MSIKPTAKKALLAIFNSHGIDISTLNQHSHVVVGKKKDQLRNVYILL